MEFTQTCIYTFILGLDWPFEAVVLEFESLGISVDSAAFRVGWATHSRRVYRACRSRDVAGRGGLASLVVWVVS